MSDYQPNAVLTEKDHCVVGTRPVRPDGADKVTGKAQYGADIILPGLLYARALRSPHAHAHIRSIDGRRALELPGVKAVVTAADIAPHQSGGPAQDEAAIASYRFMCDNILARDKALYQGHAVAAVAATSPHIAEQALDLIDVDYQVLPPVFAAAEAIREGAPLRHQDLADGAPNVNNRFEFELGDIDQGFAQADIVVEKETATTAVHQGYIEPHSGTAQWHQDGNLTVWSSSQGHFNVRDFTARVVGVPVSRVRAVPLDIGGGFGGKLRVYVEPVAALLARKAGAPVKMTMTRQEVFVGTGPASGTCIRVKLGATKDGRLVAAQGHLVFEAGAFPGSSVMGGARCMMAAYDIPHAVISGYEVLVNRPKTAAYRAPGAPAAAFAMETALDELARRLQLDPLEVRLRNSARQGTRRATGPRLPQVGFVETLQAARDHDHYQTPLEGPWRGRGVAAGFWGNGSGPACAVAAVNADGTVSLAEGSPDIGGTRASVAQQLAETLGLPFAAIKPHIADTDSIGFTSMTGGSGVTFKTGWAAYEAGQDIKRQLVERAARIWEMEANGLEYREGGVHDCSDPTRSLSFAELAARQNDTGGPVVGRAGVNPGGAGPALAVHMVDVEVDPETGKVDILRYTAVQDAGKAIHPSYVEGQMQGAAAQGVGWALNEEYFIDQSGRMLNASFLDYRMPTSLDLPMIDTVIVEVANPNHPYGVRGVGEAPIVPPMAAIANALHDATGVRFDMLPMNPARIVKGLTANGAVAGV
ncbi:MAG: molybdopterin-dependent oxidoreductase [Candidatus Latescibacteria bacterium]|nr:molybdopterin-dependent oxidoreductase [Candidatus Latescibacterota bacterium]